MIIYKVGNLKIYESRSDKPKTDWTGKAAYVIDETDGNNAELIAKVKEYAPFFDFVANDNGVIVDVIKSGEFLPERIKTPIELLTEENAALNAKIKALTESNAILEECIVEMAEIVYA